MAAGSVRKSNFIEASEMAQEISGLLSLAGEEHRSNLFKEWSIVLGEGRSSSLLSDVCQKIMSTISTGMGGYKDICIMSDGAPDVALSRRLHALSSDLYAFAKRVVYGG